MIADIVAVARPGAHLRAIFRFLQVLPNHIDTIFEIVLARDLKKTIRDLKKCRILIIGRGSVNPAKRIKVETNGGVLHKNKSLHLATWPLYRLKSSRVGRP